MDYCDICFDPPKPLECTASGTVRLDAVDGERRLLGDLAFRENVRLHYVEVAATRRVWSSDRWALCAVTVYNRSSLALQRVVVTPGASAFLDGIIRVNGVAVGDEGAVVPGLGPGCAAVVTWEAENEAPGEGELSLCKVDYEYRFGGEAMTGTIWAK